jgi:hypothetical protein
LFPVREPHFGEIPAAGPRRYFRRSRAGPFAIQSDERGPRPRPRPGPHWEDRR